MHANEYTAWVMGTVFARTAPAGTDAGRRAPGRGSTPYPRQMCDRCDAAGAMTNQYWEEFTTEARRRRNCLNSPQTQKRPGANSSNDLSWEKKEIQFIVLCHAIGRPACGGKSFVFLPHSLLRRSKAYGYEGRADHSIKSEIGSFRSVRVNASSISDLMEPLLLLFTLPCLRGKFFFFSNGQQYVYIK